MNHPVEKFVLGAEMIPQEINEIRPGLLKRLEDLCPALVFPCFLKLLQPLFESFEVEAEILVLGLKEPNHRLKPRHVSF